MGPRTLLGAFLSIGILLAVGVRQADAATILTSEHGDSSAAAIAASSDNDTIRVDTNTPLSEAFNVAGVAGLTIEAAGGFVSDPPAPGLSARVWLDAKRTRVGLAMSRSLGDGAAKRQEARARRGAPATSCRTCNRWRRRSRAQRNRWRPRSSCRRRRSLGSGCSACGRAME